MSTIVGVQFRNTGKIYYFAPGKLTFAKGEGAIVETARGLEYGEVMIANCEVDESEIKGELKKVVRKATPKDTANYNSNLARRPKAIRDAQAMANKRNLDMKVVDAEFCFDGSKAIFYFTADQRIDFRDLVKEMAATFHCRIELRQIGIRDECKMKGGLGPCGRVCCCNCCNTDFDRVSIKMAKHQGLSLNPTKISGLCGRLMCCLKFEDEYYAETLKFMPKLNSDVTTPDGKGKVESVDMLHQTVRVRVTLSQEKSTVNEYTLEELGIKAVYPDHSCEGCGGCGTKDQAANDVADESDATDGDEDIVAELTEE